MNTEFKDIIEQYRTGPFQKVGRDLSLWTDLLRALFLSLRDAGFKKEDLTEEAFEYIRDSVKLKIDDLWTTKYVAQFSEVLNAIPEVIPEEVLTVESGVDPISKLKPEDFKEKVVDTEWLKLIGARHPDEWE